MVCDALIIQGLWSIKDGYQRLGGDKTGKKYSYNITSTREINMFFQTDDDTEPKKGFLIKFEFF